MLALFRKAITFDAFVIKFVPITGGVDFVASVASSVLHVTHGFLDLSLYLLGRAFGLGPRIAGPLTNLALGTSGCIINSTLHFFFVHFILHLVGNEFWIFASGCIRRTDFVGTSIGYLSGQ
jgi:hypothetical protein